MATRGKYKALSISTKVAILEDVAKGHSRREIAEKYGVTKSTLATFIANKDKILESQDKENFDGRRKRMRTSAYPDVEEAVLEWIRDMRSRNLPLSGPIVCEKARVFAERLNVPDFICSDGWLSRFKSRHNLVFKAVCGERADVDPDVCAHWVNERLRGILSQYSPDDIFNADETALFYKMLPEKTLAFKDDPCAGGKRSKERITVMVAANMSGTEKCRLLVLGKASKPRCFKGIKSFPVDYAANSKAWMTAQLFREWIIKLDRKFASKNRRVCIVVDNCSAHCDVQGLKAVRLEFFPPNVTATMQPMDQGVIKNLKVLYRKMVLQRIIICLENGKGYDVNLLSALHMISRAWEMVKPETISNCFRKCGFVAQPLAATPAPDAGDVTDSAFEPDLTLSEEPDIQRALGDLSFGDFVEVDNNVEVCGPLTDDDILRKVSCSAEDSHSGSESESDVCIDESAQYARPSAADVEAGLNALELYLSFEDNAESAFGHINALRGMFSAARFNRRRQQAITDYFSK